MILKQDITPEVFKNSTLDDDWYLRRWVEIAIPAWRKVLKESIEAGDKKREAYARNLLVNVLGVKDVEIMKEARD